MYSVRYGGKKGKKHTLAMSKDLIVTRTKENRVLEYAMNSQIGVEVAQRCELVMRLPAAGVEVRRLTSEQAKPAKRDALRKQLHADRALRFAGRVLVDRKSKRPVLYTENFFVKFEDQASTRKCKQILKQYGLSVKREIPYAANTFFVGAKEGTGLKVFDISDALLQEELVELCHPELIREVRQRVAFDQQWHLKKTSVNGSVVDAHANIAAAWQLSEGQDVIVAVIDDGVDIDHEEFTGTGKIVAPRDVTQRTDDPRPGFFDRHGTACAGVACANGQHGSAGVAPRARLMPIRLASGLGSQAEADAFEWAADHGAGVISCSWGPLDGDWFDPDDPLHDETFPLPDSTRLAIEHAINNGRDGKGCVICWAAGNGNESVDNDGYASFDKVIAVAACSDRSRKSVYSDFGAANWCSFPSDNFGPPAPLTPGIWTTDRMGNAGYNPNRTGGDAAGNYTDGFGGTSSACPGAAGVAALVIARNPNLRWDEVKAILKQSCDKIDTAGGNYDANGHSTLYGYGRLNGLKAVELAAPPAAAYTALHTAVQTVSIKDFAKTKLTANVGDTDPIKNVRIAVNLEHTWMGDLIVRIVPPGGTGVGPVVLHDRSGGSTHNINRTYDATSAPDLAQLQGKSPEGAWVLEVEDKAKEDQGNVLRFTVELDL